MRGVQGHLPAIFALLVAAAGWFYMFYSKAASNLSSIEDPRANQLRVRLRRVGGMAMILLAVSFYAGYVAIDRQRPSAAAGFMFAVLVLMGAVVLLGLVDLRLTRKLRKARRSGSERRQDHDREQR
jgi:UDP-N-acetylmuramyl pentapeptide phosphotransferase/UDP-N-acetylglucosamine-1-phosphate transferase